MTWYRVGNLRKLFSNQLERVGSSFLQQAHIEYRPLVPSTIILCFKIQIKIPGQVIFVIEGAGARDDELKEMLKQYAHIHQLDDSKVSGDFRIRQIGRFRSFSIRINANDDQEAFFKFLFTFNQKEKSDLITHELLSEFKKIVKYVTENNCYKLEFKHDIKNKSEINFEKLIDVRDLKDKHDIALSLKKILSRGENPNLLVNGSKSIIKFYIHFDKLSEVELLLIYGLNPFMRIDGECSAIEFAWNRNKMEYLDLIRASQTKPEKSQALTKIQRQSSHMLGSIFELESGEKIHTYCKKTSNMTKWEWIELLKLYMIYFKINDDNKNVIETKLSKEIIDENKYIDFIFVGERLIGFNIYQIVHLESYPNIVNVYSLYTLIHNDYEHTKIAPILDFRFGYAVQCLFPNKIIVFMGLLVSDDAYGMAEKTGLHFPKYIYKGAKRFVKQLLHAIDPELAVKYKHKDIANWIKDDVTLQKEMPAVLSFFFKYILNYGNGPITEARSAPCFFMLSGETLSSLNGLAVRLNISLSKAIIDMVRVLVKIQRPENLARYSYPFSHGEQMFWKGERQDDRKSKGVELIARACEIYLNEPNAKL